MRIFYTPIADASIYEEYNWKNSGYDEIIEIGKEVDGINSVRSLIQFDTSIISSSFVNGTLPINTSFDMKLFIARADNLNLNQQLDISIVSRSWVEGTGYFYQNDNVPYTASQLSQGGYIETNGVTWNSRYSGSLWTTSGSEFYTSSLSGAIGDPVVDMTFDISTLIRYWVSGTFVNNGLIISFPNYDELDIGNIGNIRFFSRNTHTVYSPQLIAKWNDQIFTTGTLSASSPFNILVSPKNLQPKYKIGETVRVDLSVRDRYPLKTFDTVFSNYTGNQFLSSASYYSIIDQQSNTTIIPFDQYSQISCDGSTSYFIFNIQGMYAGRYYKILVQSFNSGREQIYDTGHLFTIETI